MANNEGGEIQTESETEDAVLRLEELKQTKSRAKSVFTRAKHRLLQLLEEDEAPPRNKVK